MQYDPVKDRLMVWIKQFPLLRKLFFGGLDMLFLRQWYVKRSIRSLYPKKQNISLYDAGSGFCQYSDYILGRWTKSTVLATDLKRDYVEQYAIYAHKKYPERFKWKIADLVEYKPEQRFNLIVAIDILEHIENDRQVLQNFYNCLDIDGKLIISTPSDKDETARFTAEHVRPGYAENEIKEKLMTAGFAIKSFRFSYGKWGNRSWKLAIKYPLLLLSISKLSVFLLPIYYVCLYPLTYLLMLIDINFESKAGNGIFVIAEKNS
jgi:SAM-dependent methyltransferase